MSRILVISFILLAQFSFQYQVETDAPKSILVNNSLKTEYVVVFVIDGPRYTETFGDSSCQFIPRMGKQLNKEGVLFTNFMNNGVTHTTPGHTAITTGVYQRIKNNGTVLPKNPSFMQYYLKQTGAPQTSCWILSSKGKLHVLGKTKNKQWKDQFLPSRYCGINGDDNSYAGDAHTWTKINEIYPKFAPKLSLINMLAVDVNGHQNKWEGYKKALIDCDQYVYDFWQLIQKHPLMKDKTSLFITNDHGRHLDGHKDGFVSHGDKCKGCKHISLLAIGPDFKKNVVIKKERELIDISKTIAFMMKFDMPSSKGKVMDELFAN
jgi:hypothetical protein